MFLLFHFEGTPPFQDLITTVLIPAPGSVETDYWANIEDLGGNRYHENDWWRVEPNPPWEKIELNFTAPAGAVVYVDSFHVATECIPEPSTILLLGCGALGLFGIIIRNRRKQKNNSDE
jgi:hypothetical protein